jgi:hypothetical protein
VQIIGPPLPAERHAARKEALAWLKGADPLADRLRPYAATPALSAAPPADARVLEVRRQDSPGDAPDIVASVHASAPTTFVVRESWHPRWRAFVDGKEARVQRVTPDFFAVAVPAGDHALAFRFDRPGWVWLTWLLAVLVPLGVTAPRLASRVRARVRARRR